MSRRDITNYHYGKWAVQGYVINYNMSACNVYIRKFYRAVNIANKKYFYRDFLLRNLFYDVYHCS